MICPAWSQQMGAPCSRTGPHRIHRAESGDGNVTWLEPVGPARESGMTIVEWLIVATFAAIILAIVIPNLSEAMKRERARRGGIEAAPKLYTDTVDLGVGRPYRFVDCEAEVVCYGDQSQVGWFCLPLAQTALECLADGTIAKRERKP